MYKLPPHSEDNLRFISAPAGYTSIRQISNRSQNEFQNHPSIRLWQTVLSFTHTLYNQDVVGTALQNIDVYRLMFHTSISGYISPYIDQPNVLGVPQGPLCMVYTSATKAAYVLLDYPTHAMDTLIPYLTGDQKSYLFPNLGMIGRTRIWLTSAVGCDSSRDRLAVKQALITLGYHQSLSNSIFVKMIF